MAPRAVLIPHGSDGPANEDRASTWLTQLGYELDWRHVDNGDPLDQPDDSVAITVIYGGGTVSYTHLTLTTAPYV